MANTFPKFIRPLLIAVAALGSAFAAQAGQFYSYDCDSNGKNMNPCASVEFHNDGSDKVKFTVTNCGLSGVGDCLKNLCMTIKDCDLSTVKLTDCSNTDCFKSFDCGHKSYGSCAFDCDVDLDGKNHLDYGKSLCFTLTGKGLCEQDFEHSGGKCDKMDCYSMFDCDKGHQDCKYMCCHPVPEPASMAALGSGVLLMIRRKRARKS